MAIFSNRRSSSNSPVEKTKKLNYLPKKDPSSSEDIFNKKSGYYGAQLSKNMKKDYQESPYLEVPGVGKRIVSWKDREKAIKDNFTGPITRATTIAKLRELRAKERTASSLDKRNVIKIQRSIIEKKTGITKY